MPTSSHRDEGYIKFSFAHEAAPAPVHPRLHDLMRIRDDLHEWALIGVLPDGSGYGNLSARIPGSTRFVITASGTPLAHQAHVLLSVDHPEDYDRYSPMVSRLLHLTVIDILTTGVALRLGPDLRPMLQDIKRNLRAKRYTAP